MKKKKDRRPFLKVLFADNTSAVIKMGGDNVFRTLYAYFMSQGEPPKPITNYSITKI